MTKSQKQHFKQTIDTQIQTLTQEIESLKVAHIMFKQEQSIHFQRYTEATKRLNRLKHAYLKIETAKYGIS